MGLGTNWPMMATAKSDGRQPFTLSAGASQMSKESLSDRESV